MITAPSPSRPLRLSSLLRMLVASCMLLGSLVRGVEAKALIEATPPPPPIEARIDVHVKKSGETGEAAVGDPVTVTITARPTEQGVTIDDILPPDDPDGLILQTKDGGQSTPPPAADGTISRVLTYRIGLGGVAIAYPPVSVEWSRNGEKQQPFSLAATEDSQVRVAALSPPRDLNFEYTKPLALPFDWTLRNLVIVASLALLAALAWGVVTLMNRAAAARIARLPPPPPAPPHVVALDALDELKRSGLLDRGEYKEFCTQLADIFRVYLGARFEVPNAIDLTTYELMTELDSAGAPESTARSQFRRVLDFCDLVKFANVRPQHEGCDARYKEVYELVRLFGDRPAPPPPAPPAAETGNPAAPTPSNPSGESNALASS